MGLIPVSLTTLDKKTVKILRKEIEIYDKKLKDPNLRGSESAFLRNQRNKNKAQINKTLGLYDKHFNGKFKDDLQGMTNSVMSVQKIYERIGGTAFTNSYDTTGWAPEFLQNFLARPGENALLYGGTALALSCFMKTQLGEGAKGLLAEGMKAIFTTEVPLTGEMLTAAQAAGAATTTTVLNWAAIGIAAGALALIGGLAYRNYRRKKEMTAAIAREAEEAAYEGTARDENALNAARTDKEKFEALVQEAADDPEAFQHLQMVVRNSPGTVYAKMAQRILVAAQNAKNKEDFSLAAQTVQGKLEGTPEAMQYLDERDAIANIEDLFKKQKDAKSRLTATPVVVTVQQKIDKVFTMTAADLVSAYGTMSEDQFKAEITNGLPAAIAESVEFKTQVANAWEKVTKAKEYSELSNTTHLESALMGTSFDTSSPEQSVLDFITSATGTSVTGASFVTSYPNVDAFVLACVAKYSGPKLPTEIENYVRSVYASMGFKKTKEEKKGAVAEPTVTSATANAAKSIIKNLMKATSAIVKKTLAACPTEADFVALVTKGVPAAEKPAIEAYAKQVYAYLGAKNEFETNEPKFTAYGLTDEAKAKKVDVDKLLTYTGAQLETLLKTTYKTEADFVTAFKLPTGNASATAFEAYLKNVYKALTSKREFEAAGPAKRTSYDLDHSTITAEVKKPEETIKNFPTVESYVERFPDNMKPFARAAYESMQATVAYKSAVAENNATVTAAGKVTHINGHAENANRNAFYNIFQPLVDAGTSFRDETGNELFIDLKNAIAAGKSTKEIAQILKSKYGIDLEKMREASKGAAEKTTEKKETEAEAEAEA